MCSLASALSSHLAPCTERSHSRLHCVRPTSPSQDSQALTLLLPWYDSGAHTPTPLYTALHRYSQQMLSPQVLQEHLQLPKKSKGGDNTPDSRKVPRGLGMDIETLLLPLELRLVLQGAVVKFEHHPLEVSPHSCCYCIVLQESMLDLPNSVAMPPD